MTDDSLDPNAPLNGDNGPPEHWTAKVQILGSPDAGWNLNFQPSKIDAFLRTRMAHVTQHPEEDTDGEVNIRFDYAFPAPWTHDSNSATARLSPTPGLSFERLSYGMTYDLLEELAPLQPTGGQMVVVFSEFRVMIYTPGKPRDDALKSLINDVDIALGRLLFPSEWGSEDQR